MIGEIKLLFKHVEPFCVRNSILCIFYTIVTHLQPEGKPIHGSKGYFVNLNDGVFSQAFNVPFPTVGVVDGSQMIKVSVIGE